MSATAVPPLTVAVRRAADATMLRARPAVKGSSPSVTFLSRKPAEIERLRARAGPTGDPAKPPGSRPFRSGRPRSRRVDHLTPDVPGRLIFQVAGILLTLSSV